jgi:Zn-dependent protease with chaperone function
MTGQWVAPALALVLVAAFGLTFPHWTRHLPPAAAVRLLTGTSVVTAVAEVLLLTMIALPLVGRSDGLADYAHWSDAVFARGSSPGRAFGGVAALGVTIVLGRLIRESRAQRRAAATARSFRQRLGTTAGGVIVVASDAREAMAVNGDVIVVTAGLLRCLTSAERRAVLAHERAHVSHRHHRYVRAARLIAAVNPLLFRVPSTAEYLIERWADEDAVGVTSRAVVASALTQAAAHDPPGGHRGGGLPVPVALSAATVAVGLRLRALHEQPSPQPSRLIPPLLLVTAVVIATMVVTERTVDLFQIAVHHS